jgi:hypothetical protein
LLLTWYNTFYNTHPLTQLPHTSRFLGEGWARQQAAWQTSAASSSAAHSFSRAPPLPVLPLCTEAKRVRRHTYAPLHQMSALLWKGGYAWCWRRQDSCPGSHLTQMCCLRNTSCTRTSCCIHVELLQKQTVPALGVVLSCFCKNTRCCHGKAINASHEQYSMATSMPQHMASVLAYDCSDSHGQYTFRDLASKRWNRCCMQGLRPKTCNYSLHQPMQQKNAMQHKYTPMLIIKSNPKSKGLNDAHDNTCEHSICNDSSMFGLSFHWHCCELLLSMSVPSNFMNDVV